MRRQLSYECPECHMTTNTYIIENIIYENYNDNDPGYSLEFISDNLSDYVGQRIKCGQCKIIITIPEKSKYSQIKETAGDDSLPMYTIKRVSKNESLKGKNGGQIYNHGSKITDSCFIATATFGSAHSNELEYLRNFRDNHLMTNLFGRIFVTMYYYLSPPIAKRIESGLFIKKFSKNVLLRFIQIIKY